MIEKWIERAKELGFDTATPCDTKTLIPMEKVREMCAADRCQAYNKNWTCPPNCGTLEECGAKMHSFEHGILLQTIGHMTKDIDSKCYRETEHRHMKNFLALAKELRQEHPDCLALGAGGCRVCKKCAYPEPCRFPDQAYSSMEGYGLFVTQVCRDNCVPYYYGERTIAYSACILFGKGKTP